MNAIDQFKQDVRAGWIDVERLIDVVVTLHGQLESAQRELEAAKHRIAELERQAGGPATAKCDEPFSVRAEEKRQQARHQQQRKR